MFSQLFPTIGDSGGDGSFDSHWLRERLEDLAGQGPVLPPGVWRYRNCLRRAYDDVDARIASISFSISRFGDFTHRIDFPKRVTVAAAIEAAERYLSEPFDAAYYESVKEDCFVNLGSDTPKTFEEMHKNGYLMRGDLLTDLKYLEDVRASTTPDNYFLCCES